MESNSEETNRRVFQMGRKKDDGQNQGLLGRFLSRKRSEGTNIGCSCGKLAQKSQPRKGCCDMQIIEIEEKKD